MNTHFLEEIFMDLATVDQLLTTTRSVRKRLDLQRPVERAVVEECLRLALQAPSGSNRQGWHFLVITEPAKRAAIAAYYRQAFKEYLGADQPSELEALRAPVTSGKTSRVLKSASYLSRHLHEVPVHVIPCIEGRVENAGLMAQASRSLMLALRSRGLGSVWTTLHLAHEAAIAALLGIPPTITQAALIPIAYFSGDDFKPAKRKPLHEVTHWEQW
jgi:nitroreductase